MKVSTERISTAFPLSARSVAAVAGIVPFGLDLDGDVVDAETVVERAADLGEEAFAVAALGGHNVGGERLAAAGDRPDVEVVDPAHVGDGEDGPAHLVDVDVARRRLHEDAERLFDQRPRGP